MTAVRRETRPTHASVARSLLRLVAPAVCLALAGACSAPASLVSPDEAHPPRGWRCSG